VPTARPDTTLTREAIVDRALRLAGREGLAAVSMRRVGAELGYSGMSLYRHVADKDELLALMVDQVLGTVTPVDPARPWRDAIVAFFVELHEVLLAHPAVARLATEHPAQGRHTREQARRVLRVLRRAGLSDALAVEAFTALSCYTIGAALYAAGRDGTADAGWVGFGSPETDPGTDTDTDLGTGGAEPDDELAGLAAHLAARTGPRQFRSGLEHLVRGYAAELPAGGDL
jgi:TetR/AcrR family transcriptional regulator, tetracycline repressor protein